MSDYATYSPEDNKLRLYPAARLDEATYTRVKAHGFKWAPKQELFVAPMWTPQREDLLTDLCGEIEDEDKSLVERQEERAGRFDEYSHNRKEDADRAHAAVHAIADGIPLGQPILVGHHSEKHARRDAEKIENGMRKAVKMWETAQYWQDRAAGAIRHAKYKERPDVRARRIKGLESDERKQQKYKDDAVSKIRLWETLHDDSATKIKLKDGTPGTFLERARFLANYDQVGVVLYQQEGSSYHSYWSAWDVLRPDGERYKDCPSLTPEQVQEKCLKAHRAAIVRYDRWLTHYANRLAYERAMLAESGGTATDKTGPEKGGACKCWASHRGGWSHIVKVNKVSVTVYDNWGNGGKNFTRVIPFDKLAAVMTKAEVDAAREAGTLKDYDDGTGFLILETAPPVEMRQIEYNPAPTDPQAPDFEAMKDSLKAGVQVVSANQLFPTPVDVAARMIELAEIEPGHRVLEPSAGTGRILGAMGGQMFGHNPERGEVVAVELNWNLCQQLMRQFPKTAVHSADFLACNGDLGKFDRIIMNPPFENGADIKHIQHALTFLKPGGKLVAICANGPRQNATLKPMVWDVDGEWIELPEGTFTGTNVRAVLLTLTTPAEDGFRLE